MSAFVLAVVGLGVLGFPMVWLASRSWTVALALAPVAASLICSAAAVASLVTHTPLLPWVAVGLIVGTVACWRWPLLTDLQLPASHLVVIAAMVAPTLMLYRLAPGAWDARSIWWFHAEWFSSGGARAAGAFSNPSFAFSHADYPPLAPATIATNWLAFGTGPQARLAQATTLLLTYSALVTLGISLTWTVSVRRPRFEWAVAVVGGALALGAASFATPGVADGLVDNLWSAWLVAAALLVLIHPPQRSTTIVGAVLLTAAVLTKNEAFAAGAMVAVLATVRHRHRLRDTWFVWIAVVVGVGWQGLSRSLGARSDLLEGGNLGKLLRGDHMVVGRIDPTVVKIVHVVGGLTVAVAAISALGLVATSSVRRRRRIGSDAWMWLLLVANLAVLGFTYVISPYPLEWHLGTSIDRTTAEPGMLLLSLAAVGLLLAVDRTRGARDPDLVTPEPDQVPSPP